MKDNELHILQSEIDKILNITERQIAQGYLDALVALKMRISAVYEKHAVDGVVPREVWYQQGYLNKTKEELIKSINNLTVINNEAIKESVKTTYAETYYQNGFSIVQQALLATPIFSLLGMKAINSIVFNPDMKKKWTTRNKSNNKQLNAQLNSIIREGINNGWGYDQISKQITKRMEIGKKRAIVIAQTETARAQNMAKQHSMEKAQESGILLKKRWISTLDSRTRDLHKELDGQTVGVNEYFTSGGHMAISPKKFGVPEHDVNCRCTMITIFEGLEPTVRMAREIDNVRGEIIEYKNYDEWKQSLK